MDIAGAHDGYLKFVAGRDRGGTASITITANTARASFPNLACRAMTFNGQAVDFAVRVADRSWRS